MKEINVCSNANWNADSNETITFKNTHTQAVTVEQDGSSPWPFTTASPFTVPQTGSGPGDRDVTLIQNPNYPTPTGYCYKTVHCPGDPRNVNPKTVIIT